MTVFVGNLEESLKPQPGERRYVFRFFSGGPVLFQRFVDAMPEAWKLHTFQNVQGHPSCVFEITN